MDRKKLIVIAVALIAVVVIVIGAAAALLHQNDSYASKVELGYRYLQQGDYDNAALIFLEAISMDRGSEDAYYGLYQTYAHSGQTSMAMTTLRVGAGYSQSPYLQQLLAEKQAEQEAAAESGGENGTQGDLLGGDATKEDSENGAATPVLNTDLLTLLASATYDDYCARYGSDTGTTSTGYYSRYIGALGATLEYVDSAERQVLSTVNGQPYGDCVPTDIRLDNVTVLFGGISSVSYDVIRSMGGIADATNSGGTISFTYRDCRVSIVSDENGCVSSGCENHIVPTQKTQQQVQTEYTMVISVVDATTGSPVSGARVDAYQGTSASGSPVTGYSDATGKVSLTVYESGAYTVEVSIDGFITESFEVQVLTNVNVVEQSVSISPVMAADSIRFVLTWGSTPSDLDSHLEGATGEGENVSVYYGNRSVYGGGEMIAELDVDDRSGFGPETTTLHDTSGIYEFFVIDFTGSGTMCSSGAEVKIYVGDSLYATVTVPTDLEGDYWQVCTIVDGSITVTNHG